MEPMSETLVRELPAKVLGRYASGIYGIICVPSHVLQVAGMGAFVASVVT